MACVVVICTTTTQVKAKVVRAYVDKMITLAKDGSLHARRQVLYIRGMMMGGR